MERKCKNCGVVVGKGKSFCADCATMRNKHRKNVTLKKICIRCSAVFDTCAKGGFCSPNCRTSYSNEQKGLARPICTCQRCGKQFKKKGGENKGTYCSRDCAFRHISEHARKRNAQAAEQCEVRRLFDYLRQCAICRIAFVADISTQQYCSDECRAEKARRDAGGYGEEKPCAVCGVDVKPKPGPKGRLFRASMCEECSAESQRASRRRRKRIERAKRSGVTHKDAPREMARKLNRLIARSGNQCPLCGLLMSKNADVNSDRALERDHIVPISKGGDDSVGNIQAVCRKCNGLKADYMPIHVALASSVSMHRNDTRH